MGILRSAGVPLTVHRLRFAVFLLACACTPEGKPPVFTNLVRGGVGGPCDDDTQCATGSCVTTNFMGSVTPPPGGYCTHECGDDSECSPGKCVAGLDGKGYCAARCEKPSHCREGYLCDAIGGDCEPSELHNLICDPRVGDCTTSDGDPGGCLRVGLGEGYLGICVRACTLDGSLSCGAGENCHLFDVRWIGGAFGNDGLHNLICFEATGSVGQDGFCDFTSDCVNGTDCVQFTTGGRCMQTCDFLFIECANGKECRNYELANPNYGYCPP